MALIKCIECGKEISDKAESCPNCGYKATPKEIKVALDKAHNKTKWNVAMLFVGVSIIMFFVFDMLSDTPHQPTDYEREQRDRMFALESAYIDAKASALHQLKSPSTAKFADFSELKYHNQGDTLYTLHSWVDSQNSFGATLRTNFKFKVKVSGFGLGYFKDLEFY